MDELRKKYQKQIEDLLPFEKTFIEEYSEEMVRELFDADLQNAHSIIKVSMAIMYLSGKKSAVLNS